MLALFVIFVGNNEPTGVSDVRLFPDKADCELVGEAALRRLVDPELVDNRNLRTVIAYECRPVRVWRRPSSEGPEA